MRFPSPTSNSVEAIRSAFQQMAEIVSKHVSDKTQAAITQALPPGGAWPTAGKSSSGAPGVDGLPGADGADGSIADVVVARGQDIVLVTASNWDILSDSRGRAITGRILEDFPMTDSEGGYVMGG